MPLALPPDAALGLALLAAAAFVALARAWRKATSAGADEAGARTASEAPPRVAPETKLQALLDGERVGRTEVVGDLRVHDRLTLPDGALVRGSLTLADDARLCGSVVVDGNVLLGERARCDDPLLVRGNLEMCRDARVAMARVEGEVVLARGALVEGTLECETLYTEAPEDWSPLPPDALVRAMERLQRQT